MGKQNNPGNGLQPTRLYVTLKTSVREWTPVWFSKLEHLLYQWGKKILPVHLTAQQHGTGHVKGKLFNDVPPTVHFYTNMCFIPFLFSIHVSWALYHLQGTDTL